MKKWILSSIASVAAIACVSAVAINVNAAAKAEDSSYTLTFDMPSQREDWAESEKTPTSYLSNATQTIAYQTEEVYAGKDAFVVTETAGTTSGQAIINTHAHGPIKSWDANKAYTVSFMVKGSPFRLSFDHTKETRMDDFAGVSKTEWTYYEYTFTPSEVMNGGAPGRYSFLIKVTEAHGKTYIDDFFIEEYTAPTTSAVVAGSAIGTLPALEAGKVWAIDGQVITAETIWNYAENKTATAIDAYTLTFDKSAAREDWAESEKTPTSYLSNATQTIAYQTEEVYAGKDAFVVTETAGTTSGQAIINTHAHGPIKSWDANKAYTVSFMVKGSPFRLSFDHTKETRMDDFADVSKTEWTYYEFTFTPSEVMNGGVPGRYSFLIKVTEAHGQTYIDNFFIEEYTASTVVEGVAIGALPAIPEKAGYTGKWMIGDKEITADTVWAYTENQVATLVYAATEYTVTFKADGEVVDTATYTVENTEITAPAVPEKVHYTGVWEAYTLDGRNKVVNAIYTPAEYTITFMNGEEMVGTATYTVENTEINAPAVPEKAHYTGAWEAYTLDGGNKTVNAVYAATEYTVTFKADGEVVDTATYTVENTEITVPAVPEKAHYTGAWETYTLDGGDKVVNAAYTAVEYTVTFKADGEVVDTATYTVENTEITVPAVPEKANYTAEWEAYVLNGGDKVVNAVYKEVEAEPDEPSEPSQPSEPSEPTPEAPQESQGGCGGTIAAATAVTLIVAAAAILRKKED